MIALVNRTVYIFVVFSILFTVIEGEFSHSKKCPKKSGKFPIPGSFCASYFICERWRVMGEENCPSDQHFNPIKGCCDYKDLYPCFEKPTRKECPSPNGRFLKNGTDCKTYFDCCNGEPTEKKCPKGLLFDDKSGKCDYEELVECEGSSRNKDCPKPNGNFLKPETRCRIYFECCKGKAKEKKCPQHQLFNVKSGKCDWKNRVTCEEKKKEDCPKPTGLFLKSGTECKVYFDCYKGKATEKSCPKNQLFDAGKRKCVKKELVTCKEGESSSESSSNESSESNESSTEISTPGESSSESSSNESSESNESSRESSTPNNKSTPPATSPDTVSERLISDSTTEAIKSPLPVTDLTTEEVKSPLPFTDSTTEVESSLPTSDATSMGIGFSTLQETTATDETSDLTELTTLVSQTPEIMSESRTQPIVTTPLITAEPTPQQITGETPTQEIPTSPKITIPTSHPTLDELTSDFETTITSTSTQEETLNTDLTTESTLVPTPSEATVEEVLSSTHIPTEGPEMSTNEDTSSSYQSSYGTKETTSEDIFTESEQTSINFKTTEPDITSEIVGMSSDSTTETISSLETRSEIFLSSTSDAYQSTIDPVLVGFVCPEKTGYYPHPTNKHKFIGCVHGNAYIMDCPSNLIYNDGQKKCVYG